MAETEDIAATSPVGERLRTAREAKGLSLEDVATQTRIPRRHLEAIEAGNWSRLPAPTYTIGFAKSFASAVGLERAEIGDEVRAEMGGSRPATMTTEVFEPADPARTMPRWLVISALAGIVLVVLLLTWLNNRSLEPEQAPAEQVAQQGQTPAPSAAPQQPAAAAGGPVVITAVAPAWVQVTDQGRKLFEGEMAQGQSFEVPQTASAPLLRAGKPEALRITIGNQVAPPVGPPGRVASNVSLRPADLMRPGGGGAERGTVPAPSAPPGVQNTTG